MSIGGFHMITGKTAGPLKDDAKPDMPTGKQPDRFNVQLPYPPSVNNYWVRCANGQVRVSPRGKAYRRNVEAVMVDKFGAPPRLEGRLSMSIRVVPPDTRERDIDNIQKALLDGLEYAGAFVKSDAQIKALHVYMDDLAPVKPGAVYVTLETLPSLLTRIVK